MEQIQSMKRAKPSLFFFSILLILCSCKTNQEYKDINNEERAKSLYNKALLKYQDYLLIDRSIPSTSIIDTLDLAIELWSTNPQFYYTKSTVFKAYGDIENSIKVLNTLYDLDSSQVQTLSLSGFYYEYLGDTSKADSLYRLALNKYSIFFESGEYSSAKIEDWAYLHIIVFGKDSTTQALESKSDLPQAILNDLESKVLNFDRDRFIQDIGYH